LVNFIRVDDVDGLLNFRNGFDGEEYKMCTQAFVTEVYYGRLYCEVLGENIELQRWVHKLIDRPFYGVSQAQNLKFFVHLQHA
jgi:hypothetical protein